MDATRQSVSRINEINFFFNEDGIEVKDCSSGERETRNRREKGNARKIVEESCRYYTKSLERSHRGN